MTQQLYTLLSLRNYILIDKFIRTEMILQLGRGITKTSVQLAIVVQLHLRIIISLKRFPILIGKRYQSV